MVCRPVKNEPSVHYHHQRMSTREGQLTKPKTRCWIPPHAQRSLSPVRTCVVPRMSLIPCLVGTIQMTAHVLESLEKLDPETFANACETLWGAGTSPVAKGTLDSPERESVPSAPSAQVSGVTTGRSCDTVNLSSYFSSGNESGGGRGIDRFPVPQEMLTPEMSAIADYFATGFV